MKGYFITGTGTGVGKTIFTACFILWLRNQGLNTIPIKPIETGISKERMSDLDLCLEIAKVSLTDLEYSLASPYKYKTPCSPCLASEVESLPYPSIQIIEKNIGKLYDKYKSIVVEGAGGIIVPITKSIYMLDLIKAMQLNVIVVAKAGLGTINHTCLSLEMLLRNNINVSGFVLNSCDQEDGTHLNQIIQDNINAICHYSKIPFLGHMPYINSYNPSKILNIFNKMPQIKTLL